MNERKRSENTRAAVAKRWRQTKAVQPAQRRMAWSSILTVALGILAVVLPVGQMDAAAPPEASAADGPGVETRRVPPRLSYILGEVSFWRPGADDWTPAEVNTPLAPGDALYTGVDGNLELQVGARAYVRAAPETELGLVNREPDYDQLEVRNGRVSLDVRSLAPGHTVELDTPHAAFTIEQTGYYRVVVDDGSTTFVSRRGGRARFSTAAGETSSVAAGVQIVIGNGEQARVATYPAPDLDGWDRWNYERTDHLIAAASARYVSPDVYGLDALDRYGSWRIEAEYGPVWFPASVGPSWAPYSDGRWIWDPFYGWTWIDAAPWGWAPCHYGRWLRVRGYWGWAPGPVVVRPLYAPAVVAFFGGENFSVAVGLGAPAVGWVALGWGEPLVPWWGGVGFVGVPWWGGWGGPWIVNNIVIYDHHHRHHRKVVHARDIHRYRHAHERHALQYARGDRFGRGRHRPGRWHDIPAQRLEPVHGRLRARPVAASLAPGEGRAVRPPDRLRQRPVVATRAAPDNRRRLREAGLRVPDRSRSGQRVLGSRNRDRAPRERGRVATERGRPPVPGHSRHERGDVRRPGDANGTVRSQRRPRGGEGNERGRLARPRPPAPRAGRPERPAPDRASTSRGRSRAPRAERPSRRPRPPAPVARLERPSTDRARTSRPSSPAARPERAAPRVAPPRERSRSSGGAVSAPRSMRPRGAPAARSERAARSYSGAARSGGGRSGARVSPRSRSMAGGHGTSSRGGAARAGGRHR